jgi:hypothetical protein
VADVSFDTPTMAELFLKQGHLRRAVGIYRKVVRERPDDSTVQQRLAELEAALAQEQPGVSMSFREHMKRVVEGTPGALACVTMGFDGIAIDSYELGGEVDIPTLTIEYAAAAPHLRRAAAEGGAGGALMELAVTGSKLSMIIRPITDEYFMAVVLAPGALHGKARYLLRITGPVVAKELS